MNSMNVHFVFKGKFAYKDLMPVFPKILDIILEENEHFQEEGDEDQRNMFLEMNMSDLRQNKKPEGYNRKGNYRLIFPIDAKEFYISAHGVKSSEARRTAEKIQDALDTLKPKPKYEMVTEEEDN